MEKYLKDMPSQVGLNLPKLEKTDEQLNKIKLPKLKKLTEKV